MMTYTLPFILIVSALCIITSLVQFRQTFRYVSEGRTARGTVTSFVRTTTPEGTVENRRKQKSRPQIEFIDHTGAERKFIGKQTIGLSESDEVEVYYLPSDGESGSPKTKGELFIVPTVLAVFGLLFLLMYAGTRNQMSLRQKLYTSPDTASQNSDEPLNDEDEEDAN